MLHIEVGSQLLAWKNIWVSSNLHKFCRIDNEWKMRLNFQGFSEDLIAE
jgi:hypothetical protein